MKKIVSIFFLIVYGFTSVGATVHMHYCMGEYVGWNLEHKENSKCGKCGMKEDAKKKGCCKDEHKEFKLKTDQQKASVADYIKVFSEPIIKPEFQFYIIAKSSVTKPCYNYYRPTPNIFIQNLQVLYCSFLI